MRKFTCACLPVPPVVGTLGVVVVIQVVVRRQQVSDSQAVSVLHGHVRTQAVPVER